MGRPKRGDTDSLKKTARILYVEQGYSQKECAEKAGVSENTISKWVEEFGWKAERDARHTAPAKRIQNIKEILGAMAERRLELAGMLRTGEGDPESVRKEILWIDSGVANWNKALLSVQEESKVTLIAYIEVMDRVFAGLKRMNPDLYLKTVEFQDAHLREISKLY